MALTSFSQFYEDIWLNRVFEKQKTGFYIDIGAFDPDIISVTKLFYDRGWSGINVEPIPERHYRFITKRPRDINLCMCASAKKRNNEFYLDTESLNKEWLDTFANDRKTIVVQTDTLANICNQYLPSSVTQIDFLAIDAEGEEERIIKSGDWQRYRPRVLVIEAIKPYKCMRNTLLDAENANWEGWESFILDAGYLFAQFDGINRYYVRAEESELLHCFAIPVHPDLDGLVKGLPTVMIYECAIAILKRYPKLYSLLRTGYRKIFRKIDNSI